MVTASQVPVVVNGVSVNDLSNTVEAVKAQPALAKFRFRLRNRWHGAAQNRSTIDAYFGAGQHATRATPFVLETDEPPVLLGKDSAPNPVEYLLHALAACLTTSMIYHAAARGIHIEEVESSLEGDIDLHGFLDLDRAVRNGYQGIQVKFKIKADVPDHRLREIAELGSSHSPVFDSLTRGVPISIAVDRL